MPVRSVRRFLALAPMAAAAVLALAAPMSASALQVTYNDLTATSTYSYGSSGMTPVTLTQSASGDAAYVDVLEFTGDGVNSIGLHSYGGAGGWFGSRSSGSGVYDVTGSFKIQLTLKNDSLAAQAIGFDYYITPGMLNLVPFNYAAGQFAQTSVGFDVNVNGSSVWNSQATLKADEATAPTFTGSTSSGPSLYSGSGVSYTVEGGLRHLDLGVLNAGESLSLTYTMNSAAKGNVVSGTTTSWDETVAGHWVEYESCTDSYGNHYLPNPEIGAQVMAAMVAEVSDYGGSDFPGSCSTVRSFIEPYVIHHETNDGDTGGSHSNTGDPFDFNGKDFGNAIDPLSGQTLFFSNYVNPVNSLLQFTSTTTGNNVPEPGALSLVALALAGAGVARRRRN